MRTIQMTVAAAVVALAGCSGQTSTSTPSSTAPSVTTATTPSASASAAASTGTTAPSAAPVTSGITLARKTGPIALGMTLAQVQSGLKTLGSKTYSTTSGKCWRVESEQLVVFGPKGGTAESIGIFESAAGYPTPKGVGIGDTLAKFKATYPNTKGSGPYTSAQNDNSVLHFNTQLHGGTDSGSRVTSLSVTVPKPTSC